MFGTARLVSAAMDPLLVITNKDAGTADQETLEVALGVLRDRTSVEVAADLRPGRSWTACCSGPDRGGSWSRAATAACTR